MAAGGLLVALHVLQFLVRGAASGPTLYDQRQTGKSNVRIDVKDAVFVAIADEFGDYDYTYDYNDLTIKPETTVKPTTTTTTTTTMSTTSSMSPSPNAMSSSTHNGSLILSADNNTLTFPAANATTDKVTVVQHTHPELQEQHIPVVVVHDTAEKKKLLPVKIFERGGPQQSRRCSPGFFRDERNRCRRVRRPPREKPQAFRSISHHQTAG